MTEAVKGPIDREQPPGVPRIVVGLLRDVALLALLAAPLMLVAGWLRGPTLPDQAPVFSLPDLDGRSVSLADYRGKTVVLNFWATWCGPCRVEAPSFAAYAEAHPDVVVLGLVADGPPQRVRVVSKDLGITYPVVQADEATLRAYGVSVYPTTVIVDPDGSVRWAHAGLMFRPQLAWLTGRIW